MCSYIEYEGMGVRKITTFNQVLLDKWLWEQDQFWRGVIKSEYGGKIGEASLWLL